MSDLLRAVASAALLAMLAGPAIAGDFGRGTHETGFTLAFGRGTELNETDEEREMHDRLARFFAVEDGKRTVVLAGKGRPVDPAEIRAGYWRWLSRTDFASSHGRYNRLADDVAADLGTLPGAFASVCAVEEVDRQRAVAARGLAGIEPQMLAAVEARRERNAGEIGRFAVAVRWRLDAYAYALDHLLVATPHDDAIGVDGLLAELEPFAGQAARGEFCAGAVAAEPAPRSRFEVPVGGPAAPVVLDSPQPK